MIVTKVGDVLSSRGAIVHGCNCIGVMGAGVALAVRNKWPQAYDTYFQEYQRCRRNDTSQLGTISWALVAPNQWIINAVTQRDIGVHRRQVDYEAVAQCFEETVRCIEDGRIDTDTIAFPKIGAGLGGGNWNIIASIIDNVVPDSIHKILYVM